ncbi:nucleotide exchange factor GrpE [Synergistaceae bacterium OttesenSCG-928-D05]|nr:nucleotide exchange factor GrpE [Synergistaceae bacterium OttesenSCG-928-D05]
MSDKKKKAANNEEQNYEEKCKEVLAEKEKVTAEYEAAQEEIKKLNEEVARARADFYNYRTRIERDRERDRKLAAEQAVQELLPVFENLERVCAAAPDKEGQLYKGIDMITRQFMEVLCGLGLEQICSEGQFDPALHEAVAMEKVEDESQDGVIVDAFRKGYKLAGRVLRPVQVKVGRYEQ